MELVIEGHDDADDCEGQGPLVDVLVEKGINYVVEQPPGRFMTFQ